MKNATMYEIDENLNAILLLIERSEDGELPEDLGNYIEKLEMQRMDKVEAICKIIRDAKTRQIGLQAELDRLKKAVEVESNRQESLKEILRLSLLAHGMTPIAGSAPYQTKLFKLRIQNNSKPEVVLPEGATPESMPAYAVRTVKEIDRTAIYEHYKATKELPNGVQLILGNHVRIS
jgi:hypothetical protein